jgi:hypothetical protein
MPNFRRGDQNQLDRLRGFRCRLAVERNTAATVFLKPGRLFLPIRLVRFA